MINCAKNVIIGKVFYLKGCDALVARAKDVLARPFSMDYLNLVFQGVIVGLIAGVIVSCFRWIIDHTLQLLFWWYPYLESHLGYVLVYALFLVAISWLLGKTLKYDLTNLVGSGVPQVEAILLGQNSYAPWQILWRKFVGGLLAICPGLFLGREGPCIQMGACVGQGLAADVFKTSKKDQQTLLLAGVAAGLAAAFSAPLAGVLFMVEEITTTFKPRVCLTALAAALSADLMTLVLLGQQPSLAMYIKPFEGAPNYVFLLILGIIIGILAYAYQYVLLEQLYVYSKLNFLPQRYHSLIPLLLTIPLGLWNAKLLGGSHDFISYVTDMSLTPTDPRALLKLLVLFFIVRFVFSMVSYGASVPGGIFMPILALGAVIGCFAGLLGVSAGWLEHSQVLGLILISMAAYFGAIEKAPFTAIVLLTEMAGSLASVFPLVFVTFIAYTVDTLLGGRPIYTALREEMYFK